MFNSYTHNKQFVIISVLLFLAFSFPEILPAEQYHGSPLLKQWKETIALGRARHSFSELEIYENIRLLAHERMMGRGTDSPETGRDFPSLFLAKELHEYGVDPLGDTTSKTEMYLTGQKRSYFQKFEATDRHYDNFSSRNIIGIIKSDSNNDCVIICAHYDHLGVNEKGEIFYGANDNSSGVAGVLQIAKAFKEYKKNGSALKRNIVIALFGAEEKGLLGSEYFVKNLPKEIRPENISAVINLDMIGRNENDQESNILYALGCPARFKLENVSPDIFKELNNINEKFKFGFELKFSGKTTVSWPLWPIPQKPREFTIDVFECSDHFSFVMESSVIFFTTGLHGGYHTPLDTYEKINFHKIKKVSEFAFLLALDLCNSAKLPTVNFEE